MDIALHLGANLTDDSQLRTCLIANEVLLARQDILVQRPRKFLDPCLTAAHEIAEMAPDLKEAREALGTAHRKTVLDAAEVDANTRRLILSSPALLAKLSQSFDGARLYPQAGARMAALRDVFAGHRISLYLAVRNPASFVPALLTAVKASVRDEILGNMSKAPLNWFDVIQDIRKSWPEASLTLWADEDTPFIWDRAVRAVAGCNPESELKGLQSWYDTILVPGAADKLDAFIRSAPPLNTTLRHRTISAFLDKYCDFDKLDVDVSITGWNERHVEMLSHVYEEDLGRFAALDDVTFLQP